LELKKRKRKRKRGLHISHFHLLASPLLIANILLEPSNKSGNTTASRASTSVLAMPLISTSHKSQFKGDDIPVSGDLL